MLTTLVGVHRIHAMQIGTVNFVDNFFWRFEKNLGLWRFKQRLIKTFDMIRYIFSFQKAIAFFNLRSPSFEIISFFLLLHARM